MVPFGCARNHKLKDQHNHLQIQSEITVLSVLYFLMPRALLYVWVRLHDLFSVRNFVCNNKHIFDFISAFYYFMHMRVKTICEFTVHAEF